MIEAWAPRVGVEAACRAFGVSPRTWRHRRQGADGRLPARPSRAKPPDELVLPSWRIDDAERARIRSVLCSEEFCDLAPAQIYDALSFYYDHQGEIDELIRKNAATLDGRESA